jgi:hypothetical protein
LRKLSNHGDWLITTVIGATLPCAEPMVGVPNPSPDAPIPATTWRRVIFIMASSRLYCFAPSVAWPSHAHKQLRMHLP